MVVDVSKLAFAIVVMAVLFSVFAWGLGVWAKKRGVAPTKGKRTLVLRETLFVDARTKVCLIEQDDELLTVALTAQGTTLLNKKKLDDTKQSRETQTHA